ncbi:MAG: NAD(P)H-hydrate dehydratase [Firmicutes bacterium]|nr:NAD(P)H-hydrate dehydratase [Bacillota bacterium]
MRLYTAEQMRQADRLAGRAGVPGLVLMENAGRAVARAAMRLCGPGRRRRVVVLAGRGGNGGDGLVAARHLGEHGLEVEVVLAAPPETFDGDARVNLEAYLGGGFGGWRVFAGEPRELEDLFREAGVVVDALLGSGTRGAPRGPAADLIACLDRVLEGEPLSRPAVLSVDLPSGLDADTGEATGPCVKADVTVTLAGVKLGLALPEARTRAGLLVLAGIGLPRACLDEAWESGPRRVEWLLPEEASGLLPERPVAGHKGTFGHVLVVAGSPGFTGAAVLAGLGALRAGAGLVTVACPEGCRATVAASRPELLTVGLPEGPDGRLAAEAGAAALRRPGFSAVVAGPGLGATPDVRRAVLDLLAGAAGRLPVVLDADALNALALEGPEGVAAALRCAEVSVVLTPHPGEMARLLGSTVTAVQADRLGVALEAARSWRAVVVLKGAGTVVAAPDGRLWLNATGGPALATGGTGDVLAGAIGGLAAQGLGPLEAALVGVCLHGLAGDAAAVEVGSRGLLASDVAERLPLAADLVEGRAGPGRDPALERVARRGPEPAGDVGGPVLEA